ncbi:MAG: hypothetical protein WC412_04445 [Candidatus Omnitrophota bacterium]
MVISVRQGWSMSSALVETEVAISEYRPESLAERWIFLEKEFQFFLCSSSRYPPKKHY